MFTCIHNAEASGLTTFRVPARAAALVGWRDAADLRAALADASLPRPFKAIGGGSNMLFTAPFCGTLLLRASIPAIELRGTSLRSDANMALDALCDLASSAGLRGMENLSGIPGTLGGALVQNAGAYGAETGTLLRSATLFDLTDGSELTVDGEWMQFAYRSSRLKKEGDRFVILSAELALSGPETAPAIDYGNLRAALGDAEPTPAAVRRAVLATRAAKLPDPAEVGSAGSFFRNPEVEASAIARFPEMPRYALPSGLVKVPAAWLIDRCGLKGLRMGGAMVWPSQPLVIVNAEGRATAADVLALEHHIVETVRNRFGITLIPEVEHL